MRESFYKGLKEPEDHEQLEQEMANLEEFELFDADDDDDKLFELLDEFHERNIAELETVETERIHYRPVFVGQQDDKKPDDALWSKEEPNYDWSGARPHGNPDFDWSSDDKPEDALWKKEEPEYDWSGDRPDVSALDWLRSDETSEADEDDQKKAEQMANALEWLRLNDESGGYDDAVGAYDESGGYDDGSGYDDAVGGAYPDYDDGTDLDQKNAEQMASALEWLRLNDESGGYDDAVGGAYLDYDDGIEREIPPEISVILETTIRSSASGTTRLRQETSEFLYTLQKYLDCRAKMDAKYLEIDEFQTIANHSLRTDSGGIIIISTSNNNGGRTSQFKMEYQQQSVTGESARSLLEVYDAARVAEPLYRDLIGGMVQKLVAKYGEDIDFQISEPPLKGAKRAQEKADDDYAKRAPGPGVSWLYDIVRGSVAFNSAKHIIDFLELLHEDPMVHIVKAKNRFENPSLTGYRDLNLHIQLNTPQGFKHICELQIHHKAIQKLSKETKSHTYYEFFRSYFAGETSSLKERLEVLKFISDGNAIDDTFLHDLLENSQDVERLERLGVLFRDQLCEYQWALRVYGRLFDLHYQAHGSKHPNVATTYNDIALVLKEKGKIDEAMDLYTESLEIYQHSFGEQHSTVSNTYFNMALILEEKEELDEAMTLYQKSLSIDKELDGDQSPSVANTYHHMATILRMQQGKLDQAMNMYEKSLEIKRTCLGPDHWSIAETLQNIAIVHKSQGRLDDSMALFQESLDIARKGLGENHPSVAIAYRNMALVMEKKGKLRLALQLYQQSLDIYKMNLGEKHTLVADIYNDMAYSLKEQGDRQAAKTFLLKSMKIKKRVYAERAIEMVLRKQLVERMRSNAERPQDSSLVTPDSTPTVLVSNE